MLSPDQQESPRMAKRRSLSSGFTLTLLLRLLSVSILSVIPLFMLDSLRISEGTIGLLISLLWIADAAGAVVAVLLIKNRFASSFLGFGMLAASFLGFGIAQSYLLELALLVGLAGLGMGMAQPYLAPVMYLASNPSKPYLGIGLYSIALSIGLIVGPFVAALSISLGGYFLFFLILASVSLLAVGELLMSRLRERGSGILIEPSLQSFSFRSSSKNLRTKGFSSAFVLNFLFSMLLPIFLSYGGVLGEVSFSISPQEILLIFTGVFAISASIRIYLANYGKNLETKLIPAAAFLVASFVMIGLSKSPEIFLLGMLLFSVPHAIIPPVANYHALKSVESDALMGANLTFSTSSGIAEFIAPMIAAVLVPLYGIASPFIVMIPLALICLVWASYSLSPLLAASYLRFRTSAKSLPG